MMIKTEDIYNLLRDIFDRGYSSSIRVMGAGVDLMLYSVAVGVILLLYGVFIEATSDGFGSIIDVIPVSGFEVIVLAGALLIYKITKYIQRLSNVDPYNRIHSVDLVVGITFSVIGLGVYKVLTPGMLSNDTIELSLKSETLFLITFYVLLTGFFALSAGLLVNGTSRLMLHILGGKERFFEIVEELRRAIATIRAIPVMKVYQRVKIYADRHDVQRPKAFIQIFCFGLNQIEPTDASEESVEAEKKLQKDIFAKESSIETNPCNAKSIDRYWPSIAGYVLAGITSISAGLLALWRYPPSSPERPVVIAVLFLMFLPSLSVIQTLLKDTAAVTDSPADWKPNRWLYTLSIIFFPLILFSASIIIFPSRTAVLYIVFGIPAIIVLILLLYLYQRHRYLGIP